MNNNPQQEKTINIHGRATCYAEKFAISSSNTRVIGVTEGTHVPTICADGAWPSSRAGHDFNEQDRGLIVVGPDGADISNIHIENLVIRGARAPRKYCDHLGAAHTFIEFVAGMFVANGNGVTISNCSLQDNSEGLHTAAPYGGMTPGTKNVVVESNYFLNNGNVGSGFQHHSYTESAGIIFRYNKFDQLLPGAPGHAIKDRSAGAKIHFNWIEGGKYQIDLVESDIYEWMATYGVDEVIGNVIIKPQTSAQQVVVHYGGDGASGDTSIYRRNLTFRDNTVVSYLPSNQKTYLFLLGYGAPQNFGCHPTTSISVRGNVVYSPNAPLRIREDSTLPNCPLMVQANNSWLQAGCLDNAIPGYSSCSGSGNTFGASPEFEDEASSNYHPAFGSMLIDQRTNETNISPRQYREHRGYDPRQADANQDYGAFETCFAACGTVACGQKNMCGDTCSVASGCQEALPPGWQEMPPLPSGNDAEYVGTGTYNDELYVVYWSSISQLAKLYRLAGSAWVDVGSIASLEVPDFAVDDDGKPTFLVVRNNGGGPQLYVVQYEWEDEMFVDPRGPAVASCWGCKFALGFGTPFNGGSLIVGRTTPSGAVEVSSLAEGGWVPMAIESGPSAEALAFAQDVDGTPLMVGTWGSEVRVSRWENAQNAWTTDWSNTFDVAPNLAAEPSLQVGPAGERYIAYVRVSPDGVSRWLYVRNAGLVGGPAPINSNMHEQCDAKYAMKPDITVDSLGRPNVVWVERYGTQCVVVGAGDRVHLARYGDSSHTESWNTFDNASIESLAPGDSAISASSAGVFVVFSAPNGSARVIVRDD